jgi:hypothetical protein
MFKFAAATNELGKLRICQTCNNVGQLQIYIDVVPFGHGQICWGNDLK